MGMGYASAHADVIQQETIEQLCPVEFAALADLIKPIGWEPMARAFQFEEQDIDDLVDALMDADESFAKIKASEIEDAYAALQKAFAAATQVGDSRLELYIGYHDCESDGSRYDEVDGVYWAVVGMYQLSPAGERMKDRITRSNFVQFG